MRAAQHPTDIAGQEYSFFEEELAVETAVMIDSGLSLDITGNHRLSKTAGIGFCSSAACVLKSIANQCNLVRLFG
jgi:hypothetical protein